MENTQSSEAEKRKSILEERTLLEFGNIIRDYGGVVLPNEERELRFLAREKTLEWAKGLPDTPFTSVDLADWFQEAEKSDPFPIPDESLSVTNERENPVFDDDNSILSNGYGYPDDGFFLNSIIRSEDYCSLYFASKSLVEHMSRQVGWEGRERSMRFRGFGGTKLLIDERSGDISYYCGNKPVFIIRPGEKGRGVEIVGEKVKEWNLDKSNILEFMSRTLLDEKNLENLRAYTRGGYEVISGICVGDRYYFSVHHDDTELRDQIAMMFREVAFVSPEEFNWTCNAYKRDVYVPGYQPENFPRGIRLVYNGRKLSSVDQWRIDNYRSRGDNYGEALFTKDTMETEYIRSQLDKIRFELEKKAGVKSSRHFISENALFPFDGFWSGNKTYLCSRCGKRREYSIETKEYKRILTTLNEDGTMALQRTFNNTEDLLSAVKDILLSKHNVNMMTKDFKEFVEHKKEVFEKTFVKSI